MINLIDMLFLKFVSMPAKIGWTLHPENIDMGIMITVLGLVVVFMVLIIIFLILTIFAMIVRDKKKPVAAPKPSVRPVPPTIPVKTENSSQEEETIDDKELVAVITAAIAASMGSSTDKFIVRRIRRTGSWNKEAIEEQQYGLY